MLSCVDFCPSATAPRIPDTNEMEEISETVLVSNKTGTIFEIRRWRLKLREMTGAPIETRTCPVMWRYELSPSAQLYLFFSKLGCRLGRFSPPTMRLAWPLFPVFPASHHRSGNGASSAAGAGVLPI